MASAARKAPTRQSTKERPQKGRRSLSGGRVGDARAIAARFREWITTTEPTTQAKFAERVGVSLPTLKRWTSRRGVNGLDAATLIHVARKVGLSLDWLLLGEGPQVRGNAQPTEATASDLRGILLNDIVSRAPQKDRERMRSTVDAVLEPPETLLRRIVDSEAETLLRVFAGEGARWRRGMEAALLELAATKSDTSTLTRDALVRIRERAQDPDFHAGHGYIPDVILPNRTEEGSDPFASADEEHEVPLPTEHGALTSDAVRLAGTYIRPTKPAARRSLARKGDSSPTTPSNATARAAPMVGKRGRGGKRDR